MQSIQRISICSGIYPMSRCRIFSSRSLATAYLNYDKDPGPLYMNKDVQKVLRSLTRTDVEKIFRKRSVKENSINFKFMTTEQIQQEIDRAFGEAERLLQMPPVVSIKDPPIRTIDEDKALTDFSDSSFVFTDITYGVPDSERMIVARHQNGTLSTVDQETRKRLNQIYFPMTGRQIRVPALFSNQHLLDDCLAKERYEFVLDLLNVQYEPYEKQYHEISGHVYQHIDEHRRFDSLRSTRHFGPMAFFLAWHRMIDNLLLDMIAQDLLVNGVDLTVLASTIHNWTIDTDKLDKIRHFSTPTDVQQVLGTHTGTELEKDVGKTKNELQADELCIALLTDFVEKHALKKVQLELAIQTRKEELNHKQQLLDGLHKAHGTGNSNL